MKKVKIYIDGRDRLGWSIDNDRSRLIKYISKLSNFSIVEKPNRADIIHNIWWNSIFTSIPNLEKIKNRFFRRSPKILVTCSNFVSPGEDYLLQREFDKLKVLTDAWIAPSIWQKEILENNGCKSFYLPFSVDLNCFKPTDVPKQKIASHFNIPYEKLRYRTIIGSFQRDSLGTNLSMAKWQKNPQRLINLLKDLPKDKYILLLAGPRRHFVIRQCKALDIPYFYLGTEMNCDDLTENSLPIENMALLYNLIDIYLITSDSEGGPKAAIEATASKTFVMSTDVGLSKDFIANDFVFRNFALYKKALEEYVLAGNRQCKKNVVESNFLTCIKRINSETMTSRLGRIYEEILGC